MALNVRIHGYGGMVQCQQAMQHHESWSSVFMLETPYQWAQLLPAYGSLSQESTVIVPDRASILRIEVPDGGAIYYEVNMGGPLKSDARLATSNSPRMVGFNDFPWYPGASISVRDVQPTSPPPPPGGGNMLDFTKPKNIIYIPALIR